MFRASINKRPSGRSFWGSSFNYHITALHQRSPHMHIYLYMDEDVQCQLDYKFNGERGFVLDTLNRCRAAGSSELVSL